ncbi:deoxyguanosinetriphosphate triphosphohydrolase [Alteromonas sp. CYL-A6]|uniref:deoxyguanosinetriphosphate triphosphohydrolase n=1 Tax=Alteromonas nitratireducens TaxID=3390813 RepID=UPI0034BF93BC
MNTLNATQHNVIQLPLPFEGFPGNGDNKSKGWSYLLADSLAFKKDMTYGIRIQKPDQETMPVWIKKLITSGQCRTIYVENLSLPVSECEMIAHLCSKHSVSLVNVSVNGKNTASNVITGPWLSQ